MILNHLLVSHLLCALIRLNLLLIVYVHVLSFYVNFK